MRIILFSSVAAILLLSACSDTGRTVTARPNSDLEQAIQSRLSADPQIQAAGIHVSASADKNEATLSGTVSSEDVRLRAVDLAKAASPGLIVTDKIEVKPREVARSEYTEDMANEARAKAKAAGDQIDRKLDDAWIYTKVKTKLATDSNTPARTINVDVRDGIVTLRGQVPSVSAKQEAGHVAIDTDGVKRVHNFLKVLSAG
jgi:osmotically-inducible protein OsmY